MKKWDAGKSCIPFTSDIEVCTRRQGIFSGCPALHLHAQALSFPHLSGSSPVCNLKTDTGGGGFQVYLNEKNHVFLHHTNSGLSALLSMHLIQLNYLQKYSFILSSPICPS